MEEAVSELRNKLQLNGDPVRAYQFPKVTLNSPQSETFSNRDVLTQYLHHPTTPRELLNSVESSFQLARNMDRVVEATNRYTSGIILRNKSFDGVAHKLDFKSTSLPRGASYFRGFYS